MKITYLKISGWDGAIRSFYMSLNNYTPDLEMEIRLGQFYEEQNNAIDEANALGLTDSPLYGAKKMENDVTEWWEEQKRKLIKFGNKHITLLKFLDITMTVQGLHRGAQDDFDAHAARFNSRIIRTSTRTKNNEQLIELSDFYKGKILPFQDLDKALDLPRFVEHDGTMYLKTSLGYINKAYIGDKDVRRGLIPLAVSSNFTVKVQAMEYCHVVRERNMDGNAHIELKQLIEQSIPMITAQVPEFTREWFMNSCLQ